MKEEGRLPPGRGGTITPFSLVLFSTSTKTRETFNRFVVIVMYLCGYDKYLVCRGGEMAISKYYKWLFACILGN